MALPTSFISEWCNRLHISHHDAFFATGEIKKKRWWNYMFTFQPHFSNTALKIIVDKERESCAPINNFSHSIYNNWTIALLCSLISTADTRTSLCVHRSSPFAVGKYSFFWHWDVHTTKNPNTFCVQSISGSEAWCSL